MVELDIERWIFLKLLDEFHDVLPGFHLGELVQALLHYGADSLLLLTFLLILILFVIFMVTPSL